MNNVRYFCAVKTTDECNFIEFTPAKYVPKDCIRNLLKSIAKTIKFECNETKEVFVYPVAIIDSPVESSKCYVLTCTIPIEILHELNEAIKEESIPKVEIQVV